MEESINRKPCKQEPLDIPLKKTKLLDDKYLLDYQYQALILAQYRHQQYNFRPWALVPPPPPQSNTPKHLPHLPYGMSIPYLSQEPPVLQNPERVVRLSECERYEQSFQPNVALAPRKLTNATNGHIKSTSDTSDTEKDKEKGKEQDGDVDRESRGHIITMDIQIKKERPNTPVGDSTSCESMELSPTLQTASSMVNPAPISPEGQSGSSNEITSSTSPVPVTKLHKQGEQTSVHSPIMSPPITDSHHINPALIRSHHQPMKPPGSHHMEQHHIGHALTNGVHVHLKHNGTPIHNSEFELSTDTDDDSIAGEADSSNNLAPLDIAIEALKDTRPKDRDRVLHLIKMLISENVQLGLRNEKLMQELRSKEEEISELMQFKSGGSPRPSVMATITNTSKIAILPIEAAKLTKTVVTKPLVNSDISGSMCELPTELETRTITIGGKNETEVIRMPLKKCMRRSPEETVVIMQAHKQCDDIRDKPDTVSRSPFDENGTKSPTLHSSLNVVITADNAADVV